MATYRLVRRSNPTPEPTSVPQPPVRPFREHVWIDYGPCGAQCTACGVDRQDGQCGMECDVTTASTAFTTHEANLYRALREITTAVNIPATPGISMDVRDTRIRRDYCTARVRSTNGEMGACFNALPCSTHSNRALELCQVRVWDGNGGDMTSCDGTLPCPRHQVKDVPQESVSSKTLLDHLDDDV